MNNIHSQFNQYLSSVDWTKYPQLMQKVVSAFMVQTAGVLNKLREALSAAQAKTLEGQLNYGFNAANSMQTSGSIQAAIGSAQIVGGGWQTYSAFKTAGEMRNLMAEFEENIGNIDSQINSSTASIEPVVPINQPEEEELVVRVEQIDDAAAAPVIQPPVSQETVDVNTLRTQREDLRYAHGNNHAALENKGKQHYGIGQMITASAGLLHVVDGGAQAKKTSSDAASQSLEHMNQTQEATRSSVNQTADKLASIDMYAVNVASTRG